MGCGWLGLPLAEKLIQEGFSICGTTTSEDKLRVLGNAGIKGFRIAIKETTIEGPIQDFLNCCEILIINVPPKVRSSGPKASYISKMQLLLHHIKNSTVKEVVFISSTSVYGNAQGTVTEKITPEPTSESGKQLLASEQLFTTQSTLRTTLVRFGGLIGPNRHPVYMLSQKEVLHDGTAPINLIHLNDCIRVLEAILKEEKWGETFNAVHPDHPEKQDYYTKEADSKGLKLPSYETSEDKIYKKINSCKPFLAKMHPYFTPL